MKIISALQPNDLIRIVSPSGVIDANYIEGAKKVLKNWGLRVAEGEYCREVYGRFAGTESQRTADLQRALDDPDTKAILCSRGGYGLAQIVDKLDFNLFRQYPKWLIGFSDITILHNAVARQGFPSIHAIMAKHLTELPTDSEPVVRLRAALFGKPMEYQIEPYAKNRLGFASGRLVGGNLSVLYGLRATPFDMDVDGNILFIEDIGEKPYHIDRMMQNLRLSGVFQKISGLIVGQFSDCDEDLSMNKTIEEIILDATKEIHFPIMFHFPAGHVENNQPLTLNCEINMEITEKGCFIKQLR